MSDSSDNTPQKAFSLKELLFLVEVSDPSLENFFSEPSDYYKDILQGIIPTLIADFNEKSEITSILGQVREVDTPIGGIFPQVSSEGGHSSPQLNEGLFVGYVRVGLELSGTPDERAHAILLATQTYNDPEYANNTVQSVEGDRTAKIIKIAPNVKLSSAPGNGLTGGGPGAFPIPISKEEAEAKAGFEFAAEFDDLSQTTGDGVMVVVFDTEFIPKPSGIENCLYDSLMSKVHLQSTTIASASASALPTNMAASQTHLTNYPHPVRDHSLFVCGIIHSIAPQASIKVYPVLDQWGTELSTVVFNELSQLTFDIMASSTMNQVIVNMSLMFTSFRDDASDTPIEKIYDDIMKNVYKLPFDALNSINGQNGKTVYVIAAVGNEKRNGKTPAADFPARYNVKNIIGVSAIEFEEKSSWNWINPPTTPSLYSSDHDTQDKEGFITFGGEAIELFPGSTRFASKEKGMIGIYFSKYPNPRIKPLPQGTAETLKYFDNTSGWARWAGTSFATPVITGFLARCLSCGKGDRDMREHDNHKPTHRQSEPDLFPVWQNQPLSTTIQTCVQEKMTAS